MVRNRIIPIFVPHVGCPHQCVFCDQRAISGSCADVDAAFVASQIAQGIARSGPGAQVAFYGGSFTAISQGLQEALLGAVQPFLQTGAVSSIRLSTRPDAIDGAVLARLHSFGVQTVELGCQSLCDDVLTRSGRGHTAAAVVRAAAMVRVAGFSLILQMMTGLPGDTDEQAAQTAREIISLQPDGVRIYPTVVVRGTPLHRLYNQGLYAPQTLEQATALCALLLEQFLAAKIPVIRLGLQPTEALSGGEAVAGPYHPAFGELVKSRIYRNRAAQLLLPYRGASAAVLAVAENRISIMTGQKRCNLTWLQSQLEIGSIKIMPRLLEDWQIDLHSVAVIDKIAK